MLTIQPANEARRTATPRVGLAVAGGGPLGFIYELGALFAVEEVLQPLDLSRLHAYVGVSSGSVIAASLANRISMAQMIRVFLYGDRTEPRFQPQLFLRPALREYLGRSLRIPGLTVRAIGRWLRRPWDVSILSPLDVYAGAVPAGIFDSSRVNEYLRDVFSRPGRTNDFRELSTALYIVAVELDSGRAVRFGDKINDVPISTAIEASAALPGLYPPVQIGDKFYVDGALRRTLNASLALQHDLDLLIAVNPIVPFQADSGRVEHEVRAGGLPRVLSQTFRALIQSRMQIGFEKYHDQFPHTSLALFEPDSNDELMFFTNLFSYSSRRKLCEHAYQRTRADLRNHRKLLSEALEGIELELDLQRLDDENRTMEQALEEMPNPHATLSIRLHHTLDELTKNLDEASRSARSAA